MYPGGGARNAIKPNVPATNTSGSMYANDLESILPGITATMGSQLGNVQNLIAGTESPAITQNMNAYWGANSGLAPGSEFLRNRAVDLYGTRSATRQAQGGQDLLNLLSGVSAPITAYRGQTIGAQTAQEGYRSAESINASRLAQQAHEFDLTFPESQREFDLGLANRQGEFRGTQQFNYADLAMRQMLGIGNLNLNTLQSYLQYLQ